MTSPSSLTAAMRKWMRSSLLSQQRLLRERKQHIAPSGRGDATIKKAAGMGHQRRHMAAALRDREYFVPQRAAPPTWSRRMFGGGGMSGDAAIGALIAANLSVFAAWQLAEGGTARRFMQRHFLCSDAAVTRDWRVHTLFTCSISHVEFWHLASNLLALYFFGRSVGAHIGGRRLLMLYTAGGVLGSAAHIAYYRFSAQQKRRQRRRRIGGDLFLYEFFRDSPPVLGASAAINSIVAYDILCFPMKIIMVNLVIPMPAAVLGGLFLSRDIFFAINGGSASRESHAAHIAGAAVGSAAYLLMSRGRIRRM